MKSERNYRSPQKYLYEKPARSLPRLPETLEVPQGMRQDYFGDQRHQQEQLFEQNISLQQRNKELEAYAHMVAHDLKDSLTILVLSSNLITNIPDLSPQELTESLQQIKSTAYSMNRIIDNLLLFAEVSKAEAPLEPVDMTRIVTNVRDRLSPMIKEYEAQINLPESWPNALGYPPWIEEVWANYLSNALKYGGQPPCVDLGASTQSDGMVCFWIRDNGSGIPPDARAKLFSPFNQGNSIHTLGHGVGLSIVLHLVEKLGGRVGVESEPGKGSIFYFTLPADPSSA